MCIKLFIYQTSRWTVCKVRKYLSYYPNNRLSVPGSTAVIEAHQSLERLRGFSWCMVVKQTRESSSKSSSCLTKSKLLSAGAGHRWVYSSVILLTNIYRSTCTKDSYMSPHSFSSQAAARGCVLGPCWALLTASCWSSQPAPGWLYRLVWVLEGFYTGEVFSMVQI